MTGVQTCALPISCTADQREQPQRRPSGCEDTGTLPVYPACHCALSAYSETMAPGASSSLKHPPCMTRCSEGVREHRPILVVYLSMRNGCSAASSSRRVSTIGSNGAAGYQAEEEGLLATALASRSVRRSKCSMEDGAAELEMSAVIEEVLKRPPGLARSVGSGHLTG